MKNEKLFNQGFTFLLLGQIISILGSAILKFALDLYILDLTGRADIFATILAISYIPYILFTPIGGVIADRFNRRNLMISFDICNSIIVAILLFTLETQQTTVITIAFILILLSLISAMYQPTVQASVPALSTEANLGQANGLITGVNAISNILGPVLGGVLYALLKLNTLVIVSLIVFICAAIMNRFIKMSFVKSERNGTFFQLLTGDLKSGFLYIKDKKMILRIILLAVGINLFLGSFLVITTPFVLRIIMHSNNTMYATGMALVEFGTIGGALSMGIFAKRINFHNLHNWLLITVIALLPMALAVSKSIQNMGYLPGFILYFIFAMLISAIATIISIWAITWVQNETPSQMLGKIMAIALSLTQIAMPIGQVCYGFLVERFSNMMFMPFLIVSVLTAGTAYAFRSAVKSQNRS